MSTAPPAARPRRRWLRVSLRGLMVLVILAGIPAGWVANTIHTQRRAIAAVRAGEGDITFDFQTPVAGINTRRTEPAASAWLRRWLGDELFQSVVWVMFRKPAPPEALAALARFDHLESLRLFDLTGVGDGLRSVRGMRNLKSIWLAGPGTTDAMLTDIAQVHSLQNLTIGRPANSLQVFPPERTSPATDAGFAQLGALRNLETLLIQDCPRLSDAGTAGLVEQVTRLQSFERLGNSVPMAATLAALARRHPDLASLNLDRTGVTDADLAAVAGMTKLWSLHLQSTRITAAGLTHLRPLKNLQTLIINDNAITDDGLAVLGELPQLETLQLNKTRVTGAGIAHLADLGRLKQLSIGINPITDADLPAVARITSLTSLTLAYAPGITDAGLIPLRSLTKLQQLDITETKVTAAGVAALKQALPMLTRVITQSRRRPTLAPAAK